MKKIIMSLACVSLLGIGACATKPKSDEKTIVKTDGDEKSKTGEAQPVEKSEPKVIYAPPSPPPGPAPYNPFTPPPVEKPSPFSGASSFEIVGIDDRIYFATDSYQLSDAARAVLEQQAQLLASNPSYQIMIEGNCDERGTREYNLALGARRANSVKDFLVALGISASRISTVSFGKERPIDERPNPDGWAINRNAHTVIQK